MFAIFSYFDRSDESGGGSLQGWARSPGDLKMHNLRWFCRGSALVSGRIFVIAVPFLPGRRDGRCRLNLKSGRCTRFKYSSIPSEGNCMTQCLPLSGSCCPRCGKDFVCGMTAGGSLCWCVDLPVLKVDRDEATQCYCQDCLHALLAIQRGTQVDVGRD